MWVDLVTVFFLLDQLLPRLFQPRKLIQKWLLVVYSKNLVFQHPFQDDVGGCCLCHNCVTERGVLG